MSYRLWLEGETESEFRRNVLAQRQFVEALMRMGNRDRKLFVETLKMVENNNFGGQVGAQGLSPRVIRSKLNQQIKKTHTKADLKALAREIKKLRETLSEKMRSADDAVELGHLAQAEKAAAKGDEAGALSALKHVGSWTVGAIKEVGTTLVTKAIEKAAGLD